MSAHTPGPIRSSEEAVMAVASEGTEVAEQVVRVHQTIDGDWCVRLNGLRICYGATRDAAVSKAVHVLEAVVAHLQEQP